MYRQYKDRVAFYVVYIEEAHPIDGWQMPENVKDNVLIASPRSADERSDVAKACVRKLGLELPSLVDDLNDSTEIAYTAWPDRIYVIDRQGRVAYKSKPGPYGFVPQDAEARLKRLLAQTRN